jgi:hypothetical protein
VGLSRDTGDKVWDPCLHLDVESSDNPKQPREGKHCKDCRKKRTKYLMRSLPGDRFSNGIIISYYVREI